MSDIQVQITENGPYKVTGDIELLDYDGNPVQTRGGASSCAAAAARRPSRSATEPTPRSGFRARWRPSRRPSLESRRRILGGKGGGGRFRVPPPSIRASRTPRLRASCLGDGL